MSISLVALYLKMACNFKSGTVVVLLICHGAEPVIASQQPGTRLPQTVPAAVTLLDGLRMQSVPNPVVHAYVGLFLTAISDSFSTVESPLHIGQRLIGVDPARMSELAKLPSFDSKTRPHFRPADSGVELWARPRHVPGSRFSFSYVGNLLKVVCLI